MKISRTHVLACMIMGFVSFLLSAGASHAEERLTKSSPSRENGDQDGEYDGFIPAVPEAEEIWVNLEGDLPSSILNRRIPIRVIRGGGHNYLLPLYLPQNVRINKDEEGGAESVTVTLLDCLAHPKVSAAIEKALTTITSAAFQPVTPIGNETRMVLSLDQGEDHLRMIGSATTFRAVGKFEHSLHFKVVPGAAAQLTVAKPDQLFIESFEHFRGRFVRTNLEGIVAVSNKTIAQFKSQLSSNPARAQATFLVAIGGDVGQNIALQQSFLQKVQLELYQRRDAENSDLVKEILNKLFENVKVTTDTLKPHDDAVVTFLLSNGVRLTAAVGDIKKMSNDQQKSLENRLVSSDDWDNKDKHETDFGVKIEGGGFGFSQGTNYDDKVNSDISKAGKKSREDYKKDLQDIKKAVEGTLPIAALSADQIQQMASLGESKFGVTIGNFVKGENTISNRMSFQEFTVNKAGRAEALARLMQKKIGLEAALSKEVARVKAAAERQKHQLKETESFPKEIEGHVAVIPAYIAPSQRESQFQQVLIHIKKMWGWQPPGGIDKTTEDHMKFRDIPDGPTCREMMQAAQKAIDDNSAAIKDKAKALSDSLAKISSQNVEVGAAIAEIARLQAEIDKVNQELLDYLER